MPYVLRRLKSEVLSDLPNKITRVERCNMLGSQRLIYHRELLAMKTGLAVKLRELQGVSYKNTHTNDTKPKRKRNSINNKLNTPTNIDTHTHTHTHTHIDAENIPPYSSKYFVNSFLARLRRVCNHPLLMRYRYSDSDQERIVTYLHKYVSGYKEYKKEKVVELIQALCDFEIHQIVSDYPPLTDLCLSPDLLLYSSKLRRALEIVRAHQKDGRKLLLFSHYVICLDILEAAFQVHMPDVICDRLDGSTPVEERSNILKIFTEGECRVFLLSTKAGGLGLNLVAAESVVLFDQDWNPHTDRQAEDRVHRIGQTKDVHVFKLICADSLEENILNTCTKKLELDTAFGGNNTSIPIDIITETEVSVCEGEGSGDDADDMAEAIIVSKFIKNVCKK
eukprot:GHVR01063460.1.p1 GENE.GHVR01063460.1~~GHVR01063460.1.p1  ORF type:complete len:393 (+),score=113.89 GHVR01063460.1:304-1482(+)